MNSFFPFTYKILNYIEKDNFFAIEYKPDDSRLSTIVFHLRVSFEDSQNEELILKMASECSPQHQWNVEFNLLSADVTKQKSLVGRNSKVNSNPISEIAQEENVSAVYDEETIRKFKEIELEAAIQKVLSKITGERV